VGKYFSDHRLKKILEYTTVFLGGAPGNMPALYSILAHVDLELGVWYPEGGMGSLVGGFVEICRSQGVEMEFNREVKRIVVRDGKAAGVECHDGFVEADIVVADADYHHVETVLLEGEYRSYTDRYWKKRVMAPCTYLIYLGLDKKVDGLLHHNLFLEKEWDDHFRAIYNEPSWPENPAYYVCSPSRSDKTVAPEGCENLFVLVPVALGLEDTDELRESYFEKLISHMETTLGENLRDSIVVKRIYTHRDFKSDYHAFRGTALGLAHTLRQTAILRLKHRSKKVKNLYFTGHYTHPGVGVPMVAISGEIVAQEIVKDHA
jgi:phytoene desaturase